MEGIVNDDGPDDRWAQLPCEAIRAQPGVYVGGDDPTSATAMQLVAFCLRCIATSTPREKVVRLVLWKEDVISIGFDGPPLPLEPIARFESDLPHPALYDLVMAPMVPGGSRRTVGVAMTNALSERMLVVTRHDDVAYCARFQRGCVAALLTRFDPREVLGQSWLTFRPDASVVTGTMGIDEARRVGREIARDAAAVTLEIVDRSGERADW